MIGNLVGGFLVIIIGVTIAPTVANTIEGARYYNDGTGDLVQNPNITGASSTILGLTTLFYMLAVASVGIGIATVGLRNSGLL